MTVDMIAAAAMDGQIPAGRFVLRQVRKSDAGLFALYAGDRRRLETLLASLPLAPDGLVVVEHRAGSLGDFSPPRMRLEAVRKWGTTGMALFRPATPSRSPDSA